MRSAATTYRFFVSDELLDRSIDAIHRCSLVTRRYESLHTTIGYAAQWFMAKPPHSDTIQKLLESFPIDGPHKIHLTIHQQAVEDFRAAGEAMSKRLGRELNPKQRFAVLVQQLAPA